MKWWHTGDIQIGSRVWFTRRIAAAAVAIVVALTGLNLATTIDLPSWENEVTSETSVPLLITMRNISQYHAATGTFQTLVERDVDTPLPDFISGEHITVYAVGTVDATVDFGQLTEDNIEVSDDRRSVRIELPAVTLTPAALDPFQTKVVNNSRGFVERFGDAYNDVPDDHRDIYVQAQGVLNQSAAASDLRTRGTDNTRAMLVGMLGSLGFTEVEITFAEPKEAVG